MRFLSARWPDRHAQRSILSGALVIVTVLVGLTSLCLVKSAYDDAKRLTQDLSAARQETRALQDVLDDRPAVDATFRTIMAVKPALDPEVAQEIAMYARSYAKLFGQDPNLVLAMMSIESGFDPRAVSPRGALGLMQILPAWRKELSIQGELTDPETSIKTGLRILGIYQHKYHDLRVAMAAYNRGPVAVNAAIKKRQNPLNDYPGLVIQRRAQLRSMIEARM